MKRLLLLACWLPLLAGCSNLSSRRYDATSLAHVHRVFVEHSLADGRGIDMLIVQELRSLGYDASAGPRTMMPDDADVVLEYDAEWTFDFTDYMISLKIEAHQPQSDDLIDSAQYFRPSFLGRTSQEMVRTVLKQIFRPNSGMAPATP